jgi:hypothetical protein
MRGDDPVQWRIIMIICFGFAVMHGGKPSQ